MSELIGHKMMIHESQNNISILFNQQLHVVH